MRRPGGIGTAADPAAGVIGCGAPEGSTPGGPGPPGLRRRSGIRRAAAIVAAAVLVVAACGQASPPSSPPLAPPARTGATPASTPEGSTPAVPPSASTGIVPAEPGETEDATVVGDRPAIRYLGHEPWQIQTPSSAAHYTVGYASAPSYLPGETLRLAVSTNASTYTVDIFRVAAEMVPMSRSDLQRGISQGPPSVDRATMLVRAPWTYTYAQQIPGDWPSGLYFALLSSGGIGGQSYVPFVIRSTRPSRFLLVSGFLNAEAYNTWGGSSLYATSIGEPVQGIRRAFAVSFDRPFSREDGMGDLFMFEVPLIAWLEANHYDVTCTTDYDLSTHPQDQPAPAAALFSGHAEYWGVRLREWLDQHVVTRGDMGLGVFAADTGYWAVRLGDDSPTGPRTEVVYKDARYDPAVAARCPGGAGPWAEAFRTFPCDRGAGIGMPEQSLFGVQYGAIVPGYHPYLIAPTTPPTLLAGTGLAPGSSLGEIVGGEVDRINPDYARIVGGEMVAHADGLPTADGASTMADAVVATLPSGGRSFGAGTFWWPWGLDAEFAADHGVPPGFAVLTANILAFLAGQ